jgi:hypothetical protein
MEALDKKFDAPVLHYMDIALASQPTFLSRSCARPLVLDRDRDSEGCSDSAALKDIPAANQTAALPIANSTADFLHAAM